MLNSLSFVAGVTDKGIAPASSCASEESKGSCSRGSGAREVREISQLEFLCNLFGESSVNVSEDVGERN